MKKVFTFLAAILLTASVFAQSPEKMSYQAVIRNSSDALVTNTPIGMQISILQGSTEGTAVYVETQTPTTNANGLVSLEIGTVVSGDDFSAIDWANGPYFIKTETDLNGGANYTITGTSQLLSVPYALHAKTAETVTGGITETDPVYSAWDKSTGITITESQISDLQNYLTTEVDGSVTNEIQNLSYTASTRVLAIDGTGSTDVTLPEATTINAGLMSAADKTKLDAAATGTAAGQMQYWNGSAWVTVAATQNEGATLQMIGGVPTWTGGTPPTPNVTNPTTGEIWMDRNLGASQVATSSTDALAYGDLYQWGRAADGHESRTSGTTSTLATSDTPGHGDFITNSSSPNDWRSPQNDNLWQGVSGTNNPCPSGYRLPTEAEWNAERTSWSSNNSAGAFASPLKLPVAGNRSNGNGSLVTVGSNGYYWSSTVSGGFARGLIFLSSDAGMNSYSRALGYSVRCLKDAGQTNQAPDASNVGFSGTLEVGETLTGSYTYSDTENDVEGTSTFQWYAADDASGTNQVQINGATSVSYILQSTDENKYLSFEVIPVAQTGTTQGTAVMSNYQGPVLNSNSTFNDVTNLTTGEIWMDRNLGASQVATSSTDAAAYGDLYQWGRAADGHESRTSGTTSTLATSDTPGHGDFITNSSSPFDWRNPQNDNLWQGVSGTNNPCPSGYRLPTEAEWEAERTSWGSNNAAGAFASPLKLPVAGYRFVSDGSLYSVGSSGYYWSSTVSGTYARYLFFDSSNAGVNSLYRADGHSVRCLKD